MKIFLLALLLIALVLITVGYVIFYLAFCRFPRDPAALRLKGLQPYGTIIDEGIAWFREQESEEVSILAWDGTRLAGHYLHHPQSRGTILLMHGFRSHALYDFSCIFKVYYELGFSLLTVHQRAHGKSGGQYITLGVKERKDCRNWCQYIADRYGSGHDIFLDGISMGAATVLMASGLDLPGSVRGIIADCGFASPYREMKHVLRSYHLPEHPFLDITDCFCRCFAGFSLKEASTLEAMEKNHLPVLFVHGQADELVPWTFSQEAYEACRAPKQLITVETAGHGLCYLMEREKMDAILSQFLERHGSKAAKAASDDLQTLSE